MDPVRPLLVLAGGLLAVLAALPGALADERAAAPAAGPSAAASPSAEPVPSLAVSTPGTSTIETTSTSDGRPRSFVLHVPQGLTGPAPLVIALHAHSQTTRNVRAYTRLEALADEEGFVVAFPSGAGGSWNAGTCCRPGSDLRTDDVAFLDEVVERTRLEASIDPDRIGITGISNGAMMALRYACERSTTVTTAAVVAGALVAPCSPTAPLPVLALQGGRDSVVPLEGGLYPRLNVVFPPVDASLDPFREAGSEVDLRILPDAAHGWMTVEEHGLDATRAVWEFVRDHPRTD